MKHLEEIHHEQGTSLKFRRGEQHFWFTLGTPAAAAAAVGPAGQNATETRRRANTI